MINEYEFVKVINLYRDVDEVVINEEGKEELITLHVPIKSNLEVPWYCRNLDKIHDFQPYYDDEGKFKKNWTSISHDFYGKMTIKESYDNMKEILKQNEQIKVNGFKYKN